jgi:hypothetical protein
MYESPSHFSALQGDIVTAQGDAVRAQSDVREPQGDANPPKATNFRQDSVTSVTSPA